MESTDHNEDLSDTLEIEKESTEHEHGITQWEHTIIKEQNTSAETNE